MTEYITETKSSPPPLGELTAHIESNDPSVWIDSTAFIGLITTAEVKDGKLHVEAVARSLSLKLAMPVEVAYTGAGKSPIHRLIYGARSDQPILIDEAPPLLPADWKPPVRSSEPLPGPFVGPTCAELAATPSLPDAVGAFLKAWDDWRRSPLSGGASVATMNARDNALAALRTAYAQVIPS